MRAESATSPDPGRGAGRARARRGRGDRVDRFPGSELLGLALRAAVPLHHRLRREGPHRAGRRLRVDRGRHRRRAHRRRLRRGRLPPGDRERAHDPQPGAPRRHLRRAHRPLRRHVRARRRRPRSSRRCASRAACSRPRTTSTPTRTAGAATRRSSTTPSRTGTCAPPRCKDELLAVQRGGHWYPEHIKHGRFGNWLENNVDWALSRERYWGTPLPIWRSEDGEETICVGSRDELRELGAEVPDDLHRPYVDDVTFERGGKTFRRVPDLIDVWWDSGCMPFAQWHAPFENQDEFEASFPADYICEALDQTRGWFYSMLAVSTLLFGRSSFETVPLPRPDPRPRGPEDVQVQGQRGGALGRARRPRRGRLPLVLLHLEAAVGRLPLLARDRRRVGAPVHEDAVEHLRLLRALRERERRRAGRHRRRGAHRPRPLGALAPAGDDRDRDRADGGLRHHHRRAARSPRSSTTSPTGTCAARAGASGTATRPPSRRCASACVTTAKLLAPLTPFIADAIYEQPRRLRALGAPVRLPGARRPRRARWSGRWRWPARPSASAARRAPTAS